jgi:extracellular elastinolytic metalloproteinase
VLVYKSSTSTGLTSQSSSPLIFDYTWNSATSPETAPNVDVARTNAFYIANTLHVRIKLVDEV